jgi:hypothetical protein
MLSISKAEKRIPGAVFYWSVLARVKESQQVSRPR